MAIEDPILSEVREARERLLAEAGGFNEYVKKLKSLESGDLPRLVTEPIKHNELSKATYCAEDSAEYDGNR